MARRAMTRQTLRRIQRLLVFESIGEEACRPAQALGLKPGARKIGRVLRQERIDPCQVLLAARRTEGSGHRPEFQLEEPVALAALVVVLALGRRAGEEF